MNTPDGNIIAFDQQSGNIVYKTDVTPALLSTARGYMAATYTSVLGHTVRKDALKSIKGQDLSNRANLFGLDMFKGMPSISSGVDAFQHTNQMEEQNNKILNKGK